MHTLVAALLLSSPPTIMRGALTDLPDEPASTPVDHDDAALASDLFTWGGIGVMVPMVVVGAVLASDAKEQLHPVGYVTVGTGILFGLIGIGLGALLDPD